MNELNLLIKLNNYHLPRIGWRVIRSLMKIKDAILSGDESGLTNTWNEICIQVQGEESFHWKIYLETIDDFIKYELKKEDDSILHLLSFFGKIKDSTFSDEEELIYDESFAIQEIMNYILTEAENYSNSRIRKYLE